MTQFPLYREHSLALIELGGFNKIFFIVVSLILYDSIDSVIKNTLSVITCFDPKLIKHKSLA